MSCVPSLVCLGGEVTKCALPHIQEGLENVYQGAIRQVTDTIQYSDFVEKLEEKQPTISWIQSEADKANYKGEDVNDGAVRELRKKEKPVIEEAKGVVSEFNRLKNNNGFTCCGFMPNVYRRHRIGRMARKCIQHIEEFRNNKQQEITGDEAPPGEVTDDSRLNSVKLNACELQSRVTILNEIKRILEDDTIQRAGLYGLEGTGKSMLINQVLNLVNQKKINLHQRVRVQVPKEEGENGIEAQIQEQIAKNFCEGILEKAKEFNDRARHLREMLSCNSEKKAVIILDGLWRKIDLDAIGIPNNDVKVCNVIVTTRDMDLLVNDMGISIENTFEVGPLSLEESTKLFLYIVRRSGQTIDEEKKYVARELVKCCGGLPKLIEQQASILTNQRDIYTWHDALREIKSQNIERMLKPVEETLSTWSSNEKDREEIRSLFNLCGLFEESSLFVRDLIVHCRALDIFTKDVTVKETKDRVKRLLHILRARSLISGNNHEVTMTELLREVAAHVAAKKNYHFIRNGSNYERREFKKWTEEQLKECIALSIDGLDILKDHPPLEYHKLKMLQLGSKHHSLEIGDEEFFNRVKKLRGLHLKNIDFKSSSFPSTVRNLENLQTLCLDDCRLKNVTHIGKLKKLQILKISRSDIIELPKDVGELTDLRLLDLRGCHKLQVIEHGILSNLKQLEELYLDDNFDQWEVPLNKLDPSRRNASLDELNEMNWLSTLYVYVPHSTMLPKNLKLEKLEKYKILLGHDVRNYSEKNLKVRTLRLNLLDSTSILWEERVKRMMQRTKSLYLKGMMRMPKPSIHQLCSQGFPCLQDLHLQNCDSVEYIIESSELVLAFPNLETLTLVNLKNLRKICNGQLMDESFGQLNAVIVEKCNALENLFDFSLMERISAIKKIEVKDCKKIKEIVTDDIGCNGGTRKKIKWDNLCHLLLENLKQIVSFCIIDTTQTESHESIRAGDVSQATAFFDGEQISFPGLQSLSLIKLPKVKKIWYQNVPPPEWSNFQSLIVEGFEETPQLEDILFYSSNNTPQKKSFLQQLTSGFSCVKAQVDYDSHSLSHQGSMPSKMEKIKNLPLQNLCYLIVNGCEKLKFLFTTSMAQALPHLTELSIADCKMMKEVIQVDKKDVGLKSIEFQKLTTLCLVSLEDLTTFSEGDLSISFPFLKSLKISNCLKLTALFMDSKDGETQKEISGSLFLAKVSPSFPSLENLDIRNMNKLIRIWQCYEQGRAISSQHGGESGGSSSKGSASKLWKTFLNIKKLHITDCASLVKIVDVECSSDTDSSNVEGSLNTDTSDVEGSLDTHTSDNDDYLDAQLIEAYLEDLTNIELIWVQNDPRGRKIRYKYLQTVSLCKCRKIESLFPASMTDDLIRLESLEVESCDGIKHLIGEENCSSRKNAPIFFFPDVKILKFQKLQQLMTFYPRTHCSEWPSLEQLMVSECNNFEIFGSEYKPSKASNKASLDSQPLFSVNKNSFCRLSTLELGENQKMKQIWRGLYPMELFQNLKVLKLISSSKVPVILPIKFLDKSPRLESLQVHNHLSPEDILKAIKLTFPLPQRTTPVTVRSLREVELNMIPGKKDLEKALDKLLGASSYSFGWLTSLKVSNCHLLEYLFTYSTATSLGCLTSLTIANCESMKVVVASEEGKAEGMVILDKLECLTLDSLQELTSFCEDNYKFEFPSLEKVTVRECSNMTKFTHGETSSPNLIKMEHEGEEIDMDDERNLNKIIKKEGVAPISSIVNGGVKTTGNGKFAALVKAQGAAKSALPKAKGVVLHE